MNGRGKKIIKVRRTNGELTVSITDIFGATYKNYITEGKRERYIEKKRCIMKEMKDTNRTHTRLSEIMLYKT